MLTALAHDDVRVIAVDRLPDKLDQARALGAHDAVTDPGDIKAGLEPGWQQAGLCVV